MADDFISKLSALAKQSGDLIKQNTLSWFLEQIKQLAMKQQKAIKAILPNIPPPKMDPIHRESQKMIQPYTLGTSSSPSQLMIGQMILYVYDPKHKATLPYYDTFPLVFPISFDSKSFLGLNMHYLPPQERANLMTALYTLLNNPTMSEKTRLNITYDVLKGSSRLRGFRPCLHRYLLGHVRSSVVRINPLEWEQVLMMPLAKFEKANTLKIWQDSIDQMRNHR